MELFTVKRYAGDSKAEDAKNEDAIIQKLLQKAEKRKRKQKSAQPPQVLDHTDTNENKSKFEKATEKDENELLDNVDPTNEDIVSNPSAKENETSTRSPDDTGFQVLGDDVNQAKRQKVEMALPSWLAYPTVIATSLPKIDDEGQSNKNDDDLQNLAYLTSETRHALKNMQIKRLFPVQETVIPWILQAQNKPYPYRPRDICVSAPTGSGKTLAFAVPVVQLLANRVECKIRALVVVPVAELALQVYKVFKGLCDKTVLNICLLSKQTPFAVEQKKLVEEYKDAYYSKVDIVVTTPGRLVDHLHSTKGFCLKSLRFLVIDEADRIMDAVFQNWLYHFDTHVRNTSDQLLSGRSAPLCLNELEQNYTQPHKLLFSATLSQDPEKLQNLRLFQPKLFTSVLANIEELAAKLANAATDEQQKESGQFLGKYITPAELSEKYCIVLPRMKPLTLFSLIKDNGWKRFLCFTNNAESASRLTFVLGFLFRETQTKVRIAELSAKMSASYRNLKLNDFARGRVNGLIASDALARGIDVPNVDIVISYDMPRHIKTYIHRVGRTARAGRAGTAVTLITQTEFEVFNKTLGEVGKVVTDEINVSVTSEVQNADVYTKALKSLDTMLQTKKQRVRATKSTNIRKSLAHKDPANLTVMEKLQIEADVQTKKLRTEITSRLKETMPQHKKMQKSKFNVNASKHKAIEK